MRRFVVCTMVTLAGMTMLFYGLAAAAARGQMRGFGGAPRLTRSSVTQEGMLAGTRRLKMTVVLMPRNPRELSAYASGVGTSGSRYFHRYLTVAQFRKRFAPGPASVASVRAALAADGLGRGTVARNGMGIELTAPVAAIEHGLRLKLRRVRIANWGQAFLNSAAPSFPRSLGGVVAGVVGLNDLLRPEPGGRRSDERPPELFNPFDAGGPLGSPGPLGSAAPLGSASPLESQRSADTSGGSDGAVTECAAMQKALPNPGYEPFRGPTQLSQAYAFDRLYAAHDVGRGQTIAFFEADGYLGSDVAAYQQCLGTHTSITDVGIDAPASDDETDGSNEPTFDLDVALGIAPAAKLVDYQSIGASDQGSYDLWQAMILSRAQTLVSTWGECQPDSAANTGNAYVVGLQTLFEEAATQGQTVVDASGDSGAQDCYRDSGHQDNSVAVDLTPADPYVTGIGGTAMTTTSPLRQTVWHEGPLGTGGGISTVWKMPSFQIHAPAELNVINSESSGKPCVAGHGHYCREVPDVAAYASCQSGYSLYESEYGGWTGECGTSGAAPLWGAVIALVNASKTCAAHRTSVGYLNPALYAVADDDYERAFSDVTSGNNDVAGNNNGEYQAGPGYDMATGLGTPLGSTLAPLLCEYASTGAVISQEQLKLALKPFVSRTDRSSAVLLAGGGLKLKFNAPETGTLTATWSRTSGGPKVAEVTERLLEPGRTTVKIALTRSGTKLLRSDKTVKLSASAMFVPASGATVRVSAAFSVKR